MATNNRRGILMKYKGTLTLLLVIAIVTVYLMLRFEGMI
jgi:hypothetical protein